VHIHIKKWRAVAFRANLMVSDLHAADVRYHRDCLAKFFTSKLSAECYAEVFDCILSKLLVQMSINFAYTWNSIELYSLYSELGGTKLSWRSLIKTAWSFLPEFACFLFPWYCINFSFLRQSIRSPCLIDDAEDDSDAQAISVVAKKIKEEC